MFKFNGSYKDLEQVAQYYPAYAAVLATLEGYPYNDSFKGKIEGIQGDNEDTAIYLLQRLNDQKRREATIDDLQADGYKLLEQGTNDTVKYQSVVKLGGNYSIYQTTTFEHARVMTIPGHIYILPKGARSRGYNVYGDTLVFTK